MKYVGTLNASISVQYIIGCGFDARKLSLARTSVLFLPLEMAKFRRANRAIAVSASRHRVPAVKGEVVPANWLEIRFHQRGDQPE